MLTGEVTSTLLDNQLDTLPEITQRVIHSSSSLGYLRRIGNEHDANNGIANVAAKLLARTCHMELDGSARANRLVNQILQ